MPTIDELAAMDYAPPRDEFTSRDYLTQYQRHGYGLRWWKAFSAPEGAIGPDGELRNDQGRIYIKQTHAQNGTPIEEVRCMLYRTRRAVYVPDFGLFEQGSTAVSVLPQQVELARLDRIAFPEVTWIARDFLTRGSTDTDILTQPPVESIENVLFYPPGDAAVIIDASHYRKTDNGIRWLDDAIPIRGAYAVEYHYLPIFEWLSVEDLGVVQRGSDRSKLPQRGLITQRHFSDFDA